MRRRIAPALTGPLALALVGLALSACSGPPPGVDGGVVGDAPRAPGVLRIGEGEREFRAVEDGDVLEIARGCQGSQHVWITLQSEAMDPRGMVVELSLERASDGVLVSPPFRLRLSFTPDAGGTFAQLTGITLQVDDPSMAIGLDLVLRARIEDRDGVEALASRRVQVVWGTQVCESPTG